MKKNSGFTLLELIATIAIISVVSLVATITYNKIKKDILNHQYENLKTLIETAGIKYSAKNGYFSFFVQDLINDGLLEPDDETDVYDPRNNKSLNCHIVIVTEEKNGNLSAKLGNEDYTSDGKCTHSSVDVYEGNLKVNAKIEGQNIEYTSRSTNAPYIYNGWTRYNLDLTLDVSEIAKTESLTNSKIVWNNNNDNTTIYPDVTITTSEYGTFDDYYYVDLYTNDETRYQARFRYMFDNEEPTLYLERGINYVDPQDEVQWAGSKKVYFYASDKNGSGIARIYIGDEDCENMRTNNSLGTPALPGLLQTYDVATEADASGRVLNVCLMDKAGNISKNKSTFSMIDRTPPVGLTVTGYKKPSNDDIHNVADAISLETIESNTWNNGYEIVVASGATDNVSEVEYFVTSRGSNTNVTNLKRNYRNVNAQGESTISFIACDLAGNCSEPVDFITKIDTKGPTVPTSVIKWDSADGALKTNENKWTNRNVWWGNWSSDDGVGIGVDHYEYSKDCTGTKTGNLSQYYLYSSNRNSKFCIRAVDKLGNEGNWSSPYYFKIDKTAPNAPTVTGYEKTSSDNASSTTGLNTIASNTWTNKYLYIVASGSTDEQSGGVKYYLTTIGQLSDVTDNEQTTRNVNYPGTVTVKFKACDAVGNCSGYTTFVSKQDRTAPSLPTVTGYEKTSSENASSTSDLNTIKSNTWTNKYLYIEASDSVDAVGGQGGTPAGGVYYLLTTIGQSSDVTDKVQTGRNVNTPGTVKVRYKACDKVGNCTSSYTEYISKQDRTAPTVPTSKIKYDSSSGQTKTNENAWTKRTLWWGSFASTDEGGSGVDHYEYSSGCTGTKTGNLSDEYTYSSSRNSEFCIRAVDKVTNASNWSSKYYFKVDKTAPTTPTVTNPYNNTWSTSAYDVTLESTDAHSGINNYQYSYSSSASSEGDDHYTQWVKYDNSATTKFTKADFVADRNQKAYFRSCDNVGNCSSVSSTTIKIDKTDPEISESISGSTYTYKCSDEMSGVKTFTVKLDGSTKSSGSTTSVDVSVTSTGSHTITTSCTDNAGNTEEKSYGVSVVNSSCSNGYGTRVSRPSSCSNGAVLLTNAGPDKYFGCHDSNSKTVTNTTGYTQWWNNTSKIHTLDNYYWASNSTWCTNSKTGYCRYNSSNSQLTVCNEWRDGPEYLRYAGNSADVYICCK